MSVDYQALRANQPERFRASADRWQDLATQFNNEISHYQHDVAEPVGKPTWSGTAAQAARKAVRADQEKLTATHRYLQTVRTLLDDAHSGATRARRRSDDGIAVAGGASLSVDANGNVSLPSGSMPVDWFNPPILAAMQAQNIINQAVHMANVVDAEVAPLLKLATKFDGDAWLRESEYDLKKVLDVRAVLDGALRKIPTDEQHHQDTEPQPYNDQWPNPEDVILWTAFTDVAVPYFMAKGWPHAARMFAHWLANSGTSAWANPDEIMKDIPTFGQIVSSAVSSAGAGHFDTGWKNTSTQDDGGHTQSLDWWYAMNDFRYRVVGRTIMVNGRKQTNYTVGVLKPYVFGPPRNPIDIPILSKITDKAKVDQESIAHLHRAGMAHNMIIQGMSHHTA